MIYVCMSIYAWIYMQKVLFPTILWNAILQFDITVTSKIFSQESFYFIFLTFSLSWILKIFLLCCILF